MILLAVFEFAYRIVLDCLALLLKFSFCLPVLSSLFHILSQNFPFVIEWNDANHFIPRIGSHPTFVDWQRIISVLFFKKRSNF